MDRKISIAELYLIIKAEFSERANDRVIESTELISIGIHVFDVTAIAVCSIHFPN